MSDVDVNALNAKLKFHQSLLDLICYYLQGSDLAQCVHGDLPNWALLHLWDLEDDLNLPDNIKSELMRYVEELRDNTDKAIGPFPPADDE